MQQSELFYIIKQVKARKIFFFSSDNSFSKSLVFALKSKNYKKLKKKIKKFLKTTSLQFDSIQLKNKYDVLGPYDFSNS